MITIYGGIAMDGKQTISAYESWDCKIYFESYNAGPCVKAKIQMSKDIKIICMLKGNTTLQIDGSIINLNQNEILLINAMIPHAFIGINEQASILSIHIKASTVCGCSMCSEIEYFYSFITYKDFTFKKLCSLPPEDQFILSRAIKEIIDEMIDFSAAHDFMISSNIYKIIGILYKNNVFNYHKYQKLHKEINTLKKLKRVFIFIESNFNDNISLRHLSDMCGHDYYYFSKLFVRVCGDSLIKYINYVRICKSIELMIIYRDRIPVKNIIEKAGFSSLTYFNRVFKQIKKISPSEYRKKNHLQL